MTTKQLSVSRFAKPTSLAAVAVLGTALFFHQRDGRAAGVMQQAPLDDGSVAALNGLDHAMEALAARVTPSVVNVAVTSRGGEEEEADGEQGGPGQGQGQGQGEGQGLPPGLQQFFGGGGGRQKQPQLQKAIGSGVILSPDGYILTNNHVVAGATQIRVTLRDRRVLTGKLVGADKLTDLAVIKVDAHDLPAIAWGDSTKLQPGQTVLAFGSPFGYFQFSVTRGIVSAINRQDPYSTDARKLGGYIQTDAAINPGNSGGPLVNAHGELIGINTMIATNSGGFEGAGFAIPEEIAKATANQIIRTGSVHHGYLGISMNDVTPENAQFFHLGEATGAIVTQVSPDSPASRAGLRNGDVIAKLNGQEIVNGSALQVRISQDVPGTKVQVGILRDGQPQTVDLTVGEYGGNKEVADAGEASGAAKGGKLGLALADLTPDVRQQLQLPEDVKGAAIESVRPGSAAEDANLQPGDVIVQVNRRDVGSAAQAVDGVRASGDGKDVLLLVWSRGGESYRVLHPSVG